MTSFESFACLYAKKNVQLREGICLEYPQNTLDSEKKLAENMENNQNDRRIHQITCLRIVS